MSSLTLRTFEERRTTARIMSHASHSHVAQQHPEITSRFVTKEEAWSLFEYRNRAPILETMRKSQKYSPKQDKEITYRISKRLRERLKTY